MSWDDEQSKRIEGARLLLSSPDVVFQELKAISKQVRKHVLWTSESETLEPILVERGVPLINLGLACYGTNKDTFKALYRHGIEPPSDAADEAYRRGLRIGCLSNVTIQKAHWVYDFPRDLLGEDEIQRILADAEFVEAETLICNPEISDDLLGQLYRREGPFAELADERLAQLVSSSGKNERLNTNEDDDHSPDLGHYRIHDAILQLVDTAPVNPRWMWALYTLLGSLNPSHVARTERLESILARWNSLVITDHDGNIHEGLFASNISLADEFRCLIAALYGTGLKKPELQMASKSSDVALRAACYANGDLTVGDMKTGLERDKGMFIYAAMYNSGIIFHREQRKFLEDSLSNEWRSKFRRHVEFIRKQYRYIEEYTPESYEDNPQDDLVSPRLGRIELATNELREKIEAVDSRVQHFLTSLITAAVVAATAFYFRHWLS